MNRFAALLILSLALPAATIAADAPYQQGLHYEKLAQPVAQTGVNAKKIVVQEFFWFGCPHCYKLDPAITRWSQHLAPDVQFERIPNSLGRPEGELDQRAFYVASHLNIEDTIHRPLFDALVRDRETLNTPELMRDFFVKTAGIKPEAFDGLYSSFIIDGDLRRADDLAASYGIDSVPTLVVGGEYLTEPAEKGFQTNLGEDALFQKMLDTVDFLVSKVREERATPPVITKH
jgi:thiol:disulfide interchange protein DsbA